MRAPQRRTCGRDRNSAIAPRNLARWSVHVRFRLPTDAGEGDVTDAIADLMKGDPSKNAPVDAVAEPLRERIGELHAMGRIEASQKVSKAMDEGMLHARDASLGAVAARTAPRRLRQLPTFGDADRQRPCNRGAPGGTSWGSIGGTLCRRAGSRSSERRARWKKGRTSVLMTPLRLGPLEQICTQSISALLATSLDLPPIGENA